MMKKRSNGYWAARSVSLESEVQEKAAVAAERIKQIYKRAVKNIDRETEDIFREFARFNGLDAEAARELIDNVQNEKSYKELLFLLEEINDEAQKEEINKKINAQAYGARMSRFETVKQRIYTEMKKAGAAEAKIQKKLYGDIVKKAYYTTVYNTAKGLNCGVDFSLINKRAVKEMLNAEWLGSNYSKRIWKNNDRFVSELQKTIEDGIAAGQSVDVMAERLKEFVSDNNTGNANYITERLVRTETAHFMSEGQAAAYEEIGAEKYIFLASLSERTCEVCGGLDGTEFRLDKRERGVNFPPIHPNCRCVTISDTASVRIARNPLDGHTYNVDGSVTFEQWKNGLTQEQREAMERHVKEMRNTAADVKQYERYKSVLGAENVPKTLDKFIDVKYNDGEKYAELKQLYRETHWQVQSLNSKVIVRNLPNKFEANSVADKYISGKCIQRRYYGKTGKPILDIDLTNHGNSKKHPVVPHYHNWTTEDEYENKWQRDIEHDKSLEKWHIIANKDILEDLE